MHRFSVFERQALDAVTQSEVTKFIPRSTLQRMKTLLIALLLVPSVLTAASAEEKRLIEVRPGVQFWANRAELARLSFHAHSEGRCGGYLDLTDYPLSNSLAPLRRLSFEGREPREGAQVTPMLKQADPGNLIALVTRLSAYRDRGYQSPTGVEAALWIKDEYVRMSRGRTDVSVELVTHRFKQPSVIATIQGSGPQKNEIVIVGGHLDSISSGGPAPGADDNASGTATVMEAFRIIAESGFRPNRTLQFMGFAGEEHGLLGSQDIATNYRNQGRQVVGALQMDMTMFPGRTPRITFITDYTNRDLNKFLERLTDEYVKAPWVEDKCGYPCSDHASWTRAGYPASFPFESPFNSHNPDIHTRRDTVEKIDANHGLSYLKLSIAFAVELGESLPAFRNRVQRY